MEQLRRPTQTQSEPEPLLLPREERREEPPPARSHQAVAAQLVHVIHGPLSLDVPLASMTVLEASPGVVALVDGREVDAATRLNAGSVLEFVRRAGVKG
jgi:hypothetical protein